MSKCMTVACTESGTLCAYDCNVCFRKALKGLNHCSLSDTQRVPAQWCEQLCETAYPQFSSNED